MTSGEGKGQTRERRWSGEVSARSVGLCAEGLGGRSAPQFASFDVGWQGGVYPEPFVQFALQPPDGRKVAPSSASEDVVDGLRVDFGVFAELADRGAALVHIRLQTLSDAAHEHGDFPAGYVAVYRPLRPVGICGVHEVVAGVCQETSVPGHSQGR